MAITYSRAQSNPSATTLTDIYTVASAKKADITTISICNRGSSAINIRLSIAPLGAADSNEQYIYYDLPLAANDTFRVEANEPLAATDVVRVYTDTATASFNIGLKVTDA